MSSFSDCCSYNNQRAKYREELKAALEKIKNKDSYLYEKIQEGIEARNTEDYIQYIYWIGPAETAEKLSVAVKEITEIIYTNKAVA